MFYSVHFSTSQIKISKLIFKAKLNALDVAVFVVFVVVFVVVVVVKLLMTVQTSLQVKMFLRGARVILISLF